MRKAPNARAFEGATAVDECKAVEVAGRDSEVCAVGGAADFVNAGALEGKGIELA